MQAKKWITVWASTGTLLATGIASINYAIDPYGMNNIISIQNFNKAKKSNTGYTYRFKSNLVINSAYDTLMIGTSRTGVMDPDTVNHYLQGNAFNFAAPASTTEIQHKIFLYTLKHNHIKNLIYGIDFMSFNDNRTIQDHFQSFYDLQKEIETYKPIKNYDLYFNLDTMQDSIEVLYKNISNKKLIEVRYQDANGMRNYLDYKDALNDNKLDLSNNINDSLQMYFYSKNAIYKNYVFSYKYLEYFKQTIAYCKQHDINVWVYIPPMHVSHLKKLYEENYFEQFEHFKRELVKVIDVTDFTGYNSININENNFWDGSHLKDELTPFVMEKILSQTPYIGPNDFGIKLNKNNINKELNKLRETLKKEL